MSVEAPAGLLIRPYAGESDIADLVAVMNAEYEADGVDERESADAMRAWLGNPSDNFVPARDVALAELSGRIVGMASQDWADSRDGATRDYRLFGAVHPDARRRGIGRALLADNERRARALAADHPRDRRPMLYGFAADGRPAGILLERAGYRVARWFIDMVRPTLEDVEVVPLPEGLELRPVTPEQYPVVWRANREAFRDHWGGSDESEAAMRRWLEGPDIDPSLWLIAWDGDEIAGGVNNTVPKAENVALGIQRGWLSSVFTRRPWRRRGLARALIGRSLVLLRERGMTSAGLNVDAENPSGALGLYEGAGFAVHQRFVAMRKPLEASPA